MVSVRLIRVAVLATASSLLLAASSAGYTQNIAEAAQPNTAEATVYIPPPPMPPATEMMRIRDGMAAADARDWYTLAALRDQANDPLIKRMLQWRYATAADAPGDFGAFADALRELDNWPGRAGMRTRAEQAIFASRLSPTERIAFLRQESGPVTGDGRIALAQALRATGQRSEANEIARAAWREDSLTPAAEAATLSDFSGALDQDDHAARAAMLLWRGERTEARALFPRLSSADRLLGTARIALQTSQRRGLQAAVDAVPSSRADDAGLLYDRTRYIRRSGRPEDAMPIAARIDAREAPAIARDGIFAERRLYVPRALRAGQHRLAYTLVSNHGMTSGEGFADAEWLSGWLQLRFLRDPARAAEHFSHLEANVSAPVSRSRAMYWRAEAARAQGNIAEAEAKLAEAARYDFTYYGQLAASRRGTTPAMLSLPRATQISDATRGRFENRELVRALRVMSQVGAQRDFESIAFYLDDTLDDSQELELLAQIARDQSYNRTALRSGKAGLFRGVVAVNAAYPLLDLPAAAHSPGRPEPALTLAIIRQESEFDVGVVSSANARGLMQLIPSTARLTARSEGLPYQLGSLTSDPHYNITLGSAHLGDLIRDFNGSYVLAIASYNAGSGRAREWIADWGDPRSSSVDVVDWIELIPFAETRNYVQRVMENLQVYRHRLNDEPTPITLDQDLRRGSY